MRNLIVVFLKLVRIVELILLELYFVLIDMYLLNILTMKRGFSFDYIMMYYLFGIAIMLFFDNL